jgi:hypothetical protein
MTFALTKYIYPLEKEIVLSEHFNFIFDNPRTDGEKELIINFITSTLEEEAHEVKPIILPLHKRVDFSIHMLKEKLKITDRYGYILNHYSGIDKKSVIEILAETWIIVRLKETQEFINLTDNTTSFSPLLASF